MEIFLDFGGCARSEPSELTLSFSSRRLFVLEAVVTFSDPTLLGSCRSELGSCRVWTCWAVVDELPTPGDLGLAAEDTEVGGGSAASGARILAPLNGSNVVTS